jgi:6-phosphogluconolactonase
MDIDMSGLIRPNIEVFSKPDELAQAAADLFVSAARRALDEKGRFFVALSGGRTPQLLFERLTTHTGARSLPWSQCHIFWVDERYVPVTDPASNFKMANECLLEPLNIPEANVYRMRTDVPLDEAVAAYESTLCSVFSLQAGDVPRFDLIQLGMGPDGHTASLFPQAYEVDTKKLVAWTVQPTAPHHRITLTPRVLQAGAQIMVLLTGKDKANMLKTVFEGQVDVMQYPIQTLWPVLDRVAWLLDREASSRL